MDSFHELLQSFVEASVNIVDAANNSPVDFVVSTNTSLLNSSVNDFPSTDMVVRSKFPSLLYEHYDNSYKIIVNPVVGQELMPPIKISPYLLVLMPLVAVLICVILFSEGP
jgi:hypothetical protein